MFLPWFGFLKTKISFYLHISYLYFSSTFKRNDDFIDEQFGQLQFHILDLFKSFDHVK